MKKKNHPIDSKPIIMTPDYLYKEGKKFYSEALEIEFEQKKDFNAIKEIYLKSILYFQGAMLLGSDDACAYLSEFYNSTHHFAINNEEVSNFTKTIGTVWKLPNYPSFRNSLCVKNYNINNDNEYVEYAIIEKEALKIRKLDWSQIPIPKYLVLNTIVSMIKQFNSKLPPKYELITDESFFECEKEIESFTKLNPSKPVINNEIWEAKNINNYNKDNLELAGAEFCIIS